MEDATTVTSRACGNLLGLRKRIEWSICPIYHPQIVDGTIEGRMGSLVRLRGGKGALQHGTAARKFVFTAARCRHPSVRAWPTLR